ncbi:NAD(P)/FAD-dependent oxidoreductase [Sphingomonas sp. MMS24-J13]|uniref:NAD(P)/FAD-dependent oxidoreductase n=1 Tax=Sphingomonas sp. MMS24-J13 TaxID=3238686 RepID=UPI00384EB3D3
MRSVDLAIVGAGVAGLSAAAAAAPWGIDVLVIEHLAPGGQVATVERIRNFPGFPDGIGGHELGPLLLQQAEEAGAEFLFNSVERIARDGEDFLLGCAGEDVRARVVILAVGSRRRALDVPGEQALKGRGVSHCASCDGPFFRGKTVIVAGGGDSAFDETEILAQHAAAVVLVHNREKPAAQEAAIARVTALPNVRILGRTEIVAVEGEGQVERVALAGPGGRSGERADGLFVYVGLDPNNDLALDLAETDARGAIIADADFQTASPGLFVAGDVRSGATALLASVAGDGAAAAHAAIRYLRTGAAA